MNAGTRLAVMTLLLWALIGGASAGTRERAPSAPPCEEWGCGSNHSETLVRDVASARQAAPSSRWLARALALVFTKARCEEWGCGMNHNETLVRDSAR